jgi:xylulokinase
VSREQLARAAHEGVVCSLIDAVDALGGHCPVDGRIVLTGGGARSRVYRQMMADLLGRPVLVPDLEEAVATGACVQSAAVAQQMSPVEVAERWGLGGGTLVEPQLDPDVAASVRAAYGKLRDATEEW